MRKYLCVSIVLIATSAHAQCNTAPSATNDATSAHADPVLVDVLANDQDDGQALTVTVIGNTCNVTVAVDDFQLVELVLTPEQPIRGDCSLTYRATDDLGLSDTGNVAVNLIKGIFSDTFESGDSSRWSAAVSQ